MASLFRPPGSFSSLSIAVLIFTMDAARTTVDSGGSLFSTWTPMLFLLGCVVATVRSRAPPAIGRWREHAIPSQEIVNLPHFVVGWATVERDPDCAASVGQSRNSPRFRPV